MVNTAWVKCAECGEIVKGRMCPGGDGTHYFPYKHGHTKTKKRSCPGKFIDVPEADIGIRKDTP